MRRGIEMIHFIGVDEANAYIEEAKMSYLSQVVDDINNMLIQGINDMFINFNPYVISKQEFVDFITSGYESCNWIVTYSFRPGVYINDSFRFRFRRPPEGT